MSFTRIFKANHGNKNMLLGKEFILWDLTQVGFQISASMLHNICLPFVNRLKALYSWENNKTETIQTGQIQTDPEKNSTKISVIAGISTLR